MRGWIRRCVLVLLLIFLCSCKRSGGNIRYFSYLDSPAQCALSGQLNGTSFTATLKSEGRASRSGEIADCTADFTLTYLSPAALAGVQVIYESGADTYRVTLGDLHAQGEEYAALGAVGKILLTESAVSTTARHDDAGVRFETMDGAVRVIDAQGVPTSVRWCDGGRCVEVDVSEWRQE